MDAQAFADSIEMYEGVLIDHGLYNIREMDEEVILFATSVGFDEEPTPEMDDETVSYIAEEATTYIQSLLPEGWWVGHDGEVGGFGVWRVEV